MSAIMLVIGVLIAVVVGILLTLTYSEEQHIRCPHCELEFTADLLLFMGNSMAQCPFCHKWSFVRKLQDRIEVKKPFT